MKSVYRFGGMPEFRVWWMEDQRGAKLFGEKQLDVKFQELNSAADWHPDWTKDKVMVVAFPLAVSKRRLQGEIRKLLDQRHDGKKGRPALSKIESIDSHKERVFTLIFIYAGNQIFDFFSSGRCTASGVRC